MYVGHFVVVSLGIGAYRISSRSFPSRRVVDQDDTLTVGLTFDAPGTNNSYIAYNYAREGGGYVVVGNGSQVDPVAEKLDLGYPPCDALAEILLAFDYKKDDYDTPRIADVVSDDKAYIGVVHKDTLVVEAVTELTLVATYEEDDPCAFDLDAETATDAARELYDYKFKHAVYAAAATVDDAVETSFYNDEWRRRNPRFFTRDTVHRTMRLGVISDVYGDLPALETVLKSMPSVDRLVCTSGMVGYNPWFEECVSELAERDVPTVSGNRDRAVTSGTGLHFNSMTAAGVGYARDALSPASVDWFSALPRNRTLAGGRIKLAHGHLNHPDHYTYLDSFSPSFLDSEDLLVLGHTRVQDYRIYDDGIMLSPGDVGQPHDSNPRAACAIADLDAMEIEAERVSYDIDRVAERVRKAGLPERLANRLYERK